jgi:hypothetical protein
MTIGALEICSRWVSAGSNPRFQGSAEQLRCSVPVALREPAPPEPHRSTSVPSRSSQTMHKAPNIKPRTRA